MWRYIFDLDNTLFYTDNLNNLSYNYALKRVGLEEINGKYRITREVIKEKYPDLSEKTKNKIIKIKQQYFKENLEKIELNIELLNKLKDLEEEKCILWTSADKERAISILKYYGILGKFKNKLFSKKNNIKKDIDKICQIFKCKKEELYFYEDDINIINKLKILNLKIDIQPK
nr:HAD hydrolase-like protein [Fusobacterium gastrosuis]